MVKIVAQPRAWWPVTFPGVAEDGEVVENRFEARFILHNEDEHAEIVAEAARLPERARQKFEEAEQNEALTAEERAEMTGSILSTITAQFVQRLAVDWRDVAAENGELLKFEPENIRQLMNMPGGVFKATVDAYKRCRLGEKDIRAGN